MCLCSGELLAFFNLWNFSLCLSSPTTHRLSWFFKKPSCICFLSRAAKGTALMSSPMSTQSKTKQQNRNVDEDNHASKAHQGCSSEKLTALWQGIPESTATWKIPHGTQPKSQDKQQRPKQVAKGQCMHMNKKGQGI